LYFYAQTLDSDAEMALIYRRKMGAPKGDMLIWFKALRFPERNASLVATWHENRRARGFVRVMVQLSFAIVPNVAAASILAPLAGSQLGTEQANRWMPLDAMTLPTQAARRTFMLDRIKREVLKRRSSLKVAELDRVLAAMNHIAREKFVDKRARHDAYLPTSLAIGYGQTITDAYIVAVMTVAAKLPPDANVLDIGTGSGYQAAVLANLARHVTSVEIVPQLSHQATRRLRHLGYRNVDVKTGDGFLGWPSAAPFDAIIVAAGGRVVPPTLIDQLKIGGRLILPVGPTEREEQLLVVTRISDRAITTCSLGLATFVPMTGQEDAKRDKDAEPVSPAAPMCFGRAVT
jgi:protein-L-isoaspartate(D-aspartate) O-methyltransferase